MSFIKLEVRGNSESVDTIFKGHVLRLMFVEILKDRRLITFWSLINMVATVNFRYFLQIKIMREREIRRQRCLLMKYIILRRRQKQKLFIIICRALISLCRKQKENRNRRVRGFERNWGWFQKVWNTYDDERFKSYFRISRETFYSF